MTDRRDLTVIVADDQALMRSGLRMLLERSDRVAVVAEAEDGNAAVRLTREHRADVVLMDVRMPGTGGIEATRRLVSDAGSTTKVLMLTTYGPR